MDGLSASDYEREYGSERDCCTVGPWVRWKDRHLCRGRGRGRRENDENPVKRPRAPKPEWLCYDIQGGLRKKFIRIKGPETIAAHPPHGSCVSYDWKCVDEPAGCRKKFVKNMTIRRPRSDCAHLSDSSGSEESVKVEPSLTMPDNDSSLTIPNIDSSFNRFRCDLSSESDENEPESE